MDVCAAPLGHFATHAVFLRVMRLIFMRLFFAQLKARRLLYMRLIADFLQPVTFLHSTGQTLPLPVEVVVAQAHAYVDRKELVASKTIWLTFSPVPLFLLRASLAHTRAVRREI